MINVGIPRALLFYQYYPMWRIFFRELGAELLVSEETNQEILTRGSSRVVPDTCLPVKVFLGHVLSLVGKCDHIFIPTVRSVREKVYNCSKFLGLPDMTRMVIPESPPILDIEIDINKGKRHLYQAIYQLGRHFTSNPVKIRRAGFAAWEAHLYYQQLMTERRLTPMAALETMFGDLEPASDSVSPVSATTKATIAIIGHPYLISDRHVSHRLISRLRRMGSLVLTPEMLTKAQLEEGVANSVGQSYWTYEDEVVGAGDYYLNNGVDGVIGIMAFGCGPDSMMMDVVRRKATQLRTTPFMCLTLDEHTAESGLVTRLEAFLDMVHRKKRQREMSCR
jgi:predicted nucleotide-binding protein (sugar kinase/HSP70/actin superfamily)